MSAAGHVSALRGTAPALRSAEPDAGRRSPHVLRPSGPLLPLAFARGVTLVALAVFGSLHWMAMLEPTAPGRAWDALGAALLAMVGLLLAARLSGPARWAAVTATSLLAILLAFLAGGITSRHPPGVRPSPRGTRSTVRAETNAISPRRFWAAISACLLYTSPSPRDLSTSRMPSSA